MTNEIYYIIEDRKFRSVRFCVCVLHRDRFLDMRPMLHSTNFKLSKSSRIVTVTRTNVVESVERQTVRISTNQRSTFGR